MYVDDLLVGGNTMEENDCNLRKVFNRLEEFGMHVNASRLVLGQRKVKYLGYDLEGGGLNLYSYI